MKRRDRGGGGDGFERELEGLKAGRAARDDASGLQGNTYRAERSVT